MAQTLHSDGTTLTVTAPTGGYTNKQVIVYGAGIGIVHEATAAGELATVALTGTHNLTKSAAANTAFSVGDPVYVTSTGAFNSTATGDSYAGMAAAAAATGDTTVRVVINVGCPVL